MILCSPKRILGVPQLIGRDAEVLRRDKDEDKTVPCYGDFKGEV